MGVPAARVVHLLPFKTADNAARQDLLSPLAGDWLEALRANLRYQRTTRQAAVTRRSKQGGAKWLLYLLCIAIPQILHEPAQGQQVGIFQNGDYEGSRLEYTNSDGVSCKFTESERASIGASIGVTQPLIVPGYGQQGGSVTSSVPVAGLTFRVPLGKGQQNCDAMREIDLRIYKLKQARLLFEDGLISKEQLEAIGRKAYKALE